ncbi:MAG: hypothetical protein M3081_00510 [Gemmatimonadota bacterium]|nr:hypothetical protein [Gemmatimonadota bacterium]
MLNFIGHRQAALAVACSASLAGVGQRSGVPAPVPIRPSDSVDVRGIVYAADEAPLDSLRAVLATGSRRDTAVVASDGSFDFGVREVPADSITIALECAQGEPRFLRSVVRLRLTDTTRAIRIVLIPARWTIAQGTYAGTVVPISVRAALMRLSDSGSFYRTTRHLPWLGPMIVSWPETMFPLRVAFRADRASRAIATRDSVAFWSVLRTLERDLGEELFQPAMHETLPVVQNQLEVEIDRRQSPEGLAWTTWNAQGDVFDGDLSLKSASLLGEPRVITHEVLHALGFGHTRSWPSALSFPATDVARATAGDAAYVQLMYRVRSMQRRLAAPFGLLEAAAGER